MQRHSGSDVTTLEGHEKALVLSGGLARNLTGRHEGTGVGGGFAANFAGRQGDRGLTLPAAAPALERNSKLAHQLVQNTQAGMLIGGAGGGHLVCLAEGALVRVVGEARHDREGAAAVAVDICTGTTRC